MQHGRYWLPVLPQDALFEIRPSPGKGLGAFATKDIEAASRILHEEPLIVIYKPDYAISHFDVESALLGLTSIEKQQFLSLGLSENGSSASPYEIFMSNKFEVTKQGQALNAEPDGEGMYLLGSRFNHSCVPNAAVIGSPPSRSNYAHAVYAIKPIAKGEEILFNYDSDSFYQTTEIRQNLGTWEFICDCRACNVNDPFHYVSDMRRALLRGLHYLLNGVDAPGCEGRKIPVTREAEKEKLTPKGWHLLNSQETKKLMTWSVLSGYCAEAEGIAKLASGHFKNAVFATSKLCGESSVARIQNAYWNDACRWATKSRDAIKSCRPADHVEVKDREQLLIQVLQSPPSKVYGTSSPH